MMAYRPSARSFLQSRAELSALKLRWQIAVLAVAILLLLAAPVAAQAEQVLNSVIYQGRGAKGFRASLDQKARATIEQVDLAVELDEAQRATLMHACQIDIARIMQEIAVIEFQSRDLDPTQMQVEDWQKVQRLAMPTRQQLDAGLHAEGSMFQKSVRTVLTPEQWESYVVALRRPLVQLCISITKLSLLDLQPVLALTHAQREAIVGLITDSQVPQNVPDNRSTMVGVAILVQLPEQQLAEILDEQQLAVIQQLRVRLRSVVAGFTW